MIAILDYDAGNLHSVEKAFQALGEPCMITRRYRELSQADRIVVPGVGAYGTAMQQLKRYELDRMIREFAESGKPMLGICLGLQLLFEGSEESGGVEGLGILEGKILRIPKTDGIKVPHVGWNSLTLRGNGRLFSDVVCTHVQQPYVYFVHSYYLQAKEAKIVKAVAEYGVQIHASIEKDQIFACQFHPEKSGAVGLQLLKNFARIGGAASA